MPTAEEWRLLAATGIVELLETEGAATQPGMEAKLADASWRYSGSLAIFPIAYTSAKSSDRMSSSDQPKSLMAWSTSAIALISSPKSVRVVCQVRG